jgi:putative transposase
VHVTLRARRGVPSLRGERTFQAVTRAVERGTKERFRIVHYSAQTDHVHLIVEGDDRRALSRGVHGLAVRLAIAINRANERRGPVWAHRYHARAMGTPKETRAGLRYVFFNFCKHLAARPGVDPRSSAPWFDGFKQSVVVQRDRCPVSQPKTWLLSGGWRRAGGPIDFREGYALRDAGRVTVVNARASP